MTNLESLFAKAIRKENQRQEFLKVIDLGSVKPFVKAVIYSPEQEEGTNMRTVPHFLTKYLARRGYKSKILVYPLAFSCGTYMKLDDFLGTLIDHEGFHSRENFEQPELVFGLFGRLKLNDDSWRSNIRASEVRAYYNVLLNPEDRNFSPEYIKKVEEKRKSYYYIGSMWEPGVYG